GPHGTGQQPRAGEGDGEATGSTSWPSSNRTGWLPYRQGGHRRSPHPRGYSGYRRTCSGDHAVRVDHVLMRSSGVELLVGLRGFVEGDLGGVDRIGDMRLVRQDELHQLTVVLLHGALAGGEVVRLGPAQSEPDPDLADLGVLVHTTGVTGDVQARNTQSGTDAGDVHDVVEHGGGRLLGTL